MSKYRLFSAVLIAVFLISLVFFADYRFSVFCKSRSGTGLDSCQAAFFK